ncbi:MAG: phage baseplate assembly protein V [Sphingobacteriaceae bacterium]|nr:phage baseplate assembly protein V [Sphingobacteriaceae bacterium]
MLKFGIISEVDAAKGLARVYFPEDDFVSGWLKMAVMRAGIDHFSFPFDIKENVYCLMDEGWEYGVICGSFYDENKLPEGSEAGKLKLSFGDNTAIIYDRKTSILSFDIKGKVNIDCTEANLTSTGKVNIEANEVNINSIETNVDGILNVSGAANIQGVVSMGGISGISGAAVNGASAQLNVSKLTASDDVTAGAISLKSHKHTSAASGSPTGPAIP